MLLKLRFSLKKSKIDDVEDISKFINSKEVKDLLFKNGIRVELDDREEKLGYRLRESVIRKIPLTLVIGDKERDNNTISYREYGSEETTTVSIDEFIKLVKTKIEEKK